MAGRKSSYQKIFDPFCINSLDIGVNSFTNICISNRKNRSLDTNASYGISYLAYVVTTNVTNGTNLRRFTIKASNTSLG